MNLPIPQQVIQPLEKSHFQEDHFNLLQMIATIDDEIGHQSTHDASHPPGTFAKCTNSNAVDEYAHPGIHQSLEETRDYDNRTERFIKQCKPDRIAGIRPGNSRCKKEIIDGRSPWRFSQPNCRFVITYSITHFIPKGCTGIVNIVIIGTNYPYYAQ